MSQSTSPASPSSAAQLRDLILNLPLDRSLNVSLAYSSPMLVAAKAGLEHARIQGRCARLVDPLSGLPLWVTQSGLHLRSSRGRLHLWMSKQPKRLRRPPQCGATTRKGTPCKCQAVLGRTRCKLHGGMSTGPKTAEGRAKIAESNRARAAKQRATRLEQAAK